MKWMIETVYRIVKGVMVKKAEDTENKEFIVRINAAFTMIETVWKEIVTPAPKENK